MPVENTFVRVCHMTRTTETESVLSCLRLVYSYSSYSAQFNTINIRPTIQLKLPFPSGFNRPAAHFQ